MKKLFFILTTLIFFTSTAFCSDECVDIPINPEIKLISSFGKLNIDNTKSKEELTSLAKENNYVEEGLFANGLSTADINFDITLKTSVETKNDKQCIIPKEVNIFLGFNIPMIYISKELIKDSCEYNVVLRHEQTHQQINKKTLEYYLPLFKSASTTIIKSIKSFNIEKTENLNKATDDYINLYNQKLTPLVDFIKKEILIQQQKLDNPDNYKYENSLCN